jgi:hypothetical protein
MNEPLHGGSGGLFSTGYISSIAVTLSVLTRTMRIRAAMLFAFLYGFCVIAPSAALAFSPPDANVHCLMELQGLAAEHDHHGNVHRHADGALHRHANNASPQKHSDADGKAHPDKCCGLFSVTALAVEPGVALSTPAPISVTFAMLEDALGGRGPERINRPPIS